MFTAAILAGGQARRLGGIDKGALAVGALTILERQLAVLRQLTPHILIVSNNLTRYSSANVPVVPDLVAGAGALGGIYTALATPGAGAPAGPVLVLACDMPFVTAPLLAALTSTLGDADAVMPRDARGRHPLCAVYARRVAAHFRSRIDRGELRVLDALDTLDVREIAGDDLHALDPAGTLLLNVNTAADHERASRAASDHQLSG